MDRQRSKGVITVETVQRTIVRRRRQPRVWCHQCPPETEMLAPNEAAAFSRTSTREIFRRVEAGDVHFLEFGDGALFVCSSSLGSRRGLPPGE